MNIKYIKLTFLYILYSYILYTYIKFYTYNSIRKSYTTFLLLELLKLPITEAQTNVTLFVKAQTLALI